jgi:hypothetical protein
MSQLAIRDPHLFLDPGYGPLVGCLDITDHISALGGLVEEAGLNERIAQAIESDLDGDGYLDVSLLQRFSPLDASAPSTSLELSEGLCTLPAATTTCSPDPSGSVTATMATNSLASCLAVLPGTSSGYTPPIAIPGAVCFATPALSLTLEILGIPIVLEDVRIAATYAGDPIGALGSGLIRGFLRESDAMSITIPASIPHVGGRALSSLLKGGVGTCGSGDDRDVGPGGAAGWYLYLNFASKLLSYE